MILTYNDLYLNDFWERHVNNVTLLGRNELKTLYKHFTNDKYIIETIPYYIKCSKISLYYRYQIWIKKFLENTRENYEDSESIITKILKIGLGHISLCGEGVYELFYESGDDRMFDFYFHCDCQNKVSELLLKCLLYIDELPDKKSYERSRNIWTIKYGDTTIRFICENYSSKYQILRSMNIIINQIGFNF